MSKPRPDRNGPIERTSLATRPGGSVSHLLCALMRRIATDGTQAQERVEKKARKGPVLPPSGQRSGCGAHSVAPFLEHARRSNPPPE